ncbi:MAG: NAD-dependent epimerase/dehydratase family protein [Pseudomonadota bacterium]
MTIVLTGVAGFIGFHAASALLDQGFAVLGIDDLNTYYDTSLKNDRLAQLTGREGFTFAKASVDNREAMTAALGELEEVSEIIHLAAQAGVRYSLVDPYSYVSSNVMGHVVMCELARSCPNIRHFVYASSSSVYGLSDENLYSLADRADAPASLYAATKRSDELISHSYSHIYDIPMTGLRFFTVYGPWGRPDMAYFSFTKAIIEEQPITLYNHGRMQRDFTYIDDIVQGILAAVQTPPPSSGGTRHRLFNLGNNRPAKLGRFVSILEEAIGKKAIVELGPMMPGDVVSTVADITESRDVLGFEPKTPLEEGLPNFVSWYKKYYKSN